MTNPAVTPTPPRTTVDQGGWGLLIVPLLICIGMIIVAATLL